jgi:hypothetical protein
MPGGNKNIKPEDGRQFSSEYQPEEKWTEKKALELGNELITWLTNKEEEGNIFFEDFLIIEKGLYRELVNYLSKKFSSFLKLINRAKEIQEIKLYKFGVADRLNAAMTKFVLINEHNKVSDNSKLDHSSSDGSMSPVTGITFDQ